VPALRPLEVGQPAHCVDHDLSVTLVQDGRHGEVAGELLEFIGVDIGPRASVTAGCRGYLEHDARCVCEGGGAGGRHRVRALCVMGVSVMDAAVVRVRSVAWAATAVVLAVVSTLLVTQAWSVGAAPGDSDSTFVPTAGCRLADTRPAPRTVGPRSTPLGADQTFTVKVHGSNGECTGGLSIPSDAVAVALNVTAVNATASSNIRLFPANLTTVPKLSNLNVTAGAPATPNKVDVKLSPDGRIKVYNFNGSVNVILDVVGYYTNSTLKELSQRVAGLEAAQAAGVDPAVLARIDSLETDVGSLETTTATNTSNIAANTSGVAALEAAQPFAEFTIANIRADLTPTPTSYLDVTVTAPVAGHVTINYSTYIRNGTTGRESVCNVFRSTEIPAFISVTPGVGYWETAVTMDGDEGSVSGTNRFDIAAGQTVIYSLACEARAGDGALSGRAMTAIFTPGP